MSAGRLFLYGLPAAPLALLSLPVYVFLPNVYATAFGLPIAAIGIVLFAVRLFDAFSDPIIGYASDRWPIFGGRRRPYILLSVPVTVLAVWMVMRPPDDVGLAYLALWSGVLSIGWTIAIIPYNAWGAELASDYHGRNRVTAVRESLVVFGTVVATALPAVLAGFGQGDGRSVLGAIAIIAAVSLPLTALVALIFVPEPRNYSRTRISLRDGIAAMRGNRPFLRLIVAFVLNGFANGLPASLFLFFAQDRLRASEAETGILLLVYFLCGVLAIPAWMVLSRRIGKHRTWCYAMIMACMAFAFVPFVGEGDIFVFAVISMITGAALGADLTLPASMQADVIDADTAATGEQRSAIYFAAWSMATKLTLAMAVGVALPLLAAFGYKPGLAGGGGLSALAIFYSLVPVGFKIAAIVLMWGFPITETRQRELRATIESSTEGS